MKIHHFSSASLCPKLHFITPGFPKKLVCHCLLIENDRELILVDTGLGTEDLKNPKKRLGHFHKLSGITPHHIFPAIDTVKKLGFDPLDVKHIILTHLDLDHAGGLSDFPHATVHIYGPEYIAAMAPTTLIEKLRYRKIQWSHSPNWNPYLETKTRWNGFEAIHELKGLPPEIYLVPLIGHTLGHCGVAIQTSETHSLLHAGDAYFHRNEMNLKNPSTPWGLDQFQKILQVDWESRTDNQFKLRALKRKLGDQISIFSSHDEEEFTQFQDRC